MFITIKSLKKTLGKYIEFQDLYIALPCFILFLILFSINATRLFSLVLFSILVFMMIPINLSKKNRMYKVMFLVFKYLINSKEYIYMKESDESETKTK